MSAGDESRSAVFETPEQLAQHVADWIVERARRCTGRFALCLSGGETPKRLYQLLGAPPRRDRFPWQRTHWFWGDERVVPPDDPRSNFHMAWQALLAHVPMRQDMIHAIPTEGESATACAADYQAELMRFYGAERLDPDRPLFDLTLLGLGEDGHTASLFPGSPALAERKRWAVPARAAAPPERITLTYPALESSAAVAFVVAGASKRAALARVRAGDPALPASNLKPAGDVYWFADRAAASAPALARE
jgi:6-phosphogluconolactonase